MKWAFVGDLILGPLSLPPLYRAKAQRDRPPLVKKEKDGAVHIIRMKSIRYIDSSAIKVTEYN